MDVLPQFRRDRQVQGVIEGQELRTGPRRSGQKTLLDLAPKFVQAAGYHAVLLYKEEIEILLRTPGYPGFSLLDLHDYPGQGTALIGPLDPFWDSKGFVAPAEHALLRADNAPAAIKEADLHERRNIVGRGRNCAFRPQGLVAVMPEWVIPDETGKVVAAGYVHPEISPPESSRRWDRIETSLAEAAAPGKLTVSISLPGTSIRNQWEIWVYPPKVECTAAPRA